MSSFNMVAQCPENTVVAETHLRKSVPTPTRAKPIWKRRSSNNCVLKVTNMRIYATRQLLLPTFATSWNCSTTTRFLKRNGSGSSPSILPMPTKASRKRPDAYRKTVSLI